ncbi:unnamed protein product [Schistosoma rodhaini]|uniref:Barh homeobox protein, putative n=3 Tax=Schistosoma mansoni TaxID=6183 RepID=A0A5K4EKI3_SCHMA|nr:unnamed protein product [Schistosoma rodhaini]
MSRKRPSFMVHDLLQETEVTFKHWQHKDLFNFQTKKKVLLDDEDENDVDDDDDISTEDIDNFSKLYNNKLNFIHQQYKSNPSSLFDVYKNDWDNCLYNIKHTIPLDKEDLMNTHLLNKTNEKEIFYYPHNPPPPHHHKNLIKKSRKARTAFTDYQLTELEQSFDRQKYLAVQDRIELASKLNLTDRQVKTWYQNRRTKWKRQTAVGLELMTETENFIAIQHLIEQNPFWAYHPTVKYILSNINPIHKSSSSSSTTLTTTTTPTTKPITVNISLNNQNSSLVTTETNELATTTTPTISDVGNHHHHHHHHQHHQDHKQHLQSTYPRILNALPVRRNSLNDEDHVHIKPSLLCIPSSNNPLFYTKSINLEQLEIRKKSINSIKNQSITNQFIDIQQLWSIIPSLNKSINNEYSNLLPSSSSSSSSSSTSLTSSSSSSSVTGICCHSLIEGT